MRFKASSQTLTPSASRRRISVTEATCCRWTFALSRVACPRKLPGGVLSVSTDQNVEGVDLELPVLESATLIVSVVRPDGRPAGGGGIEVRDANGRMMLRSFGLNDTGDVTLQGLVGQSYRIEV